MKSDAGATVSERTDAPRGALAPARVGFPVVAGAAVFCVNNFLLARLLTSLPGGTVLAATTMAAVAIVATRVRAFGAVTLLFITYAVLGILGHLGVDAAVYVTHLPRVLLAALTFDAVLRLGRFRGWALALGVAPFAAIMLLESGLSWREWLVALGLAWAGLAAGLLVAARSHRSPAMR